MQSAMPFLALYRWEGLVDAEQLRVASSPNQRINQVQLTEHETLTCGIRKGKSVRANYLPRERAILKFHVIMAGPQNG